MRVSVADPQRFVEDLKKKIGHIQGINIEVLKGKIVVDGRVLYLKDMDSIPLMPEQLLIGSVLRTAVLFCLME